ncbi:uncharacterized protein LOC105380830 [Plutella xylostella]|uniref:uncharacterized protein LOC105380830 n=1 Tax=Plutella xylostella TaxID=51655 RepID=UPI002032A707|nr:uncharacterized protein LOC105380830 [Plutella xylostella]
MKLLQIVMLLVFCAKFTGGYKFVRSILASGVQYYKILMTLGTCRGKLIFTEQKVWGNVKLNRILDIYYRSDTPDILVSRVELTIVANSTECIAYSEQGVGLSSFSASVLLPMHGGTVLYKLEVFTCSSPTTESLETTTETTVIKFCS